MTPFYIQISTWYKASYLYHFMEIVISKLLPAWVLLTPFTWPISLVLAGDYRIVHQLLLWTRCLIPFFIGLLVTFISINTYSSGSMSSLVFPLMPTSKQWLSLVVHYKYIISNILTNMQYPMHAIHILMHFKHKLRKCRKIPFQIPNPCMEFLFHATAGWLHSPCYFWHAIVQTCPNDCFTIRVVWFNELIEHATLENAI